MSNQGTISASMFQAIGKLASEVEKELASGKSADEIALGIYSADSGDDFGTVVAMVEWLASNASNFR